MNFMFKKILFIVGVWFLLSLVGGLLITKGLNTDVVLYSSIAIIATTYFIYASGNSLPLRQLDPNLLAEESKKFEQELENIRDEARSIFVGSALKNSNTNLQEISNAYKEALFITIEESLDDVMYFTVFSTHFKEILSRKPKITSNVTIDDLLVDLCVKPNKTRFQNECLSYLSYNISNKSKGLEELSLAFQIDSGHLAIRKPFNNGVGFFILRLISFIEINKRNLGISEFTRFELPSSIDQKVKN